MAAASSTRIRLCGRARSGIGSVVAICNRGTTVHCRLACYVCRRTSLWRSADGLGLAGCMMIGVPV